MSSITVLCFWISHVCLSEAIVHLVQEMMKIVEISIVQVKHLLTSYLLLLVTSSKYTANQTQLG